MTRFPLIWFLLCAAAALLCNPLRAGGLTPPSEPNAPIRSAAKENSPRKISAEGETFVLRSSSRADGVETEEYGLESQNSENWTELIICQRITLAEILNADEYVTWLKQRLQNSDPTAHVRVLQTHPRAAVFGIEYKTEDARDAQLAFVLVTAIGATRSREIQLVQYTVRPGTMDFDQLQAHAKRWQARFQSQALLAQAEANAASPLRPIPQ